MRSAAIFASLITVLWATTVAAECCDCCSCDCNCRKVCHLKCDKKKVTTYEYTCECEDFCVPCKSEKVGVKCECECKPGLCGCMKEHCCKKPIYKPTGAVVHTKKKLIKHEVVKEVPVYKWTVEKVCGSCAHRCRCCENGKTRAEVEAEVLAEVKAAGEEAVIEPIAATEAAETTQPKTGWLNVFLGKANPLAATR